MDHTVLIVSVKVSMGVVGAGWLLIDGEILSQHHLILFNMTTCHVKVGPSLI